MKNTKVIGIILLLIGLIGVIYFYVRFKEQVEAFQIFNTDVIISRGNIIPVILSGVVFILGLILMLIKRK
ncbi:MAG: hypothetical protein ACOCW8_03310 [bacterium]